MRARMTLMVGAAAAMLLAACGDDDDSAADTEAPAAATAAPAVATTEVSLAPTDATTPEASAVPGSAGSLPVPDEICALAQQMYEQDDLPTAAQLEQYKQLGPAETVDAVNVAAGAILAAGDDMVAAINAIGDDEVEAAIDEIDAWEEEHCGIPHSEDEALPAGASDEIEDGAARVDVTATEYKFDVGPVQAGRTSFVLKNAGAEAHFLLIVKLAEGVTLEEAMASEDGEGMTQGEWATGIASAGGDEETITFDVEPGTYGLLCFLPSADGTPHAMLGMQKEITVA